MFSPCCALFWLSGSHDEALGGLRRPREFFGRGREWCSRWFKNYINGCLLAKEEYKQREKDCEVMLPKKWCCQIKSGSVFAVMVFSHVLTVAAFSLWWCSHMFSPCCALFWLFGSHDEALGGLRRPRERPAAMVVRLFFNGCVGQIQAAVPISANEK